jgi:hypothetical protein
MLFNYLKLHPALLDNIGIRVPTASIRNFSIFMPAILLKIAPVLLAHQL